MSDNKYYCPKCGNELEIFDCNLPRMMGHVSVSCRNGCVDLPLVVPLGLEEKVKANCEAIEEARKKELDRQHEKVENPVNPQNYLGYIRQEHLTSKYVEGFQAATGEKISERSERDRILAEKNLVCGCDCNSNPVTNVDRENKRTEIHDKQWEKVKELAYEKVCTTEVRR